MPAEQQAPRGALLAVRQQGARFGPAETPSGRSSVGPGTGRTVLCRSSHICLSGSVEEVVSRARQAVSLGRRSAAGEQQGTWTRSGGEETEEGRTVSASVSVRHGCKRAHARMHVRHSPARAPSRVLLWNGSGCGGFSFPCCSVASPVRGSACAFAFGASERESEGRSPETVPPGTKNMHQ